MRLWTVPAIAALTLTRPAMADAEAAPGAAPAPAPAPASASAPTPTPTPTPTPAPAPAPASTPAPTPFNRLALQTEGALGVSGSFYNQLVGARFDHCFTQSTCLGGYAAYADLKGQSGRANNVLLYAMVEHRRPLGALWHIPFRAAAGYLPNNGPFARLSAGLSVAIGNFDLTFDLLAPTLWVTRNDPVLSMDLGVEVDVRF
jgi:hypothetical protein